MFPSLEVVLVQCNLAPLVNGVYFFVNEIFNLTFFAFFFWLIEVLVSMLEPLNLWKVFQYNWRSIRFANLVDLTEYVSTDQRNECLQHFFRIFCCLFAAENENWKKCKSFEKIQFPNSWFYEKRHSWYNANAQPLTVAFNCNETSSDEFL